MCKRFVFHHSHLKGTSFLCFLVKGRLQSYHPATAARCGITSHPQQGFTQEVCPILLCSLAGHLGESTPQVILDRGILLQPSHNLVRMALTKGSSGQVPRWFVPAPVCVILRVFFAGLQSYRSTRCRFQCRRGCRLRKARRASDPTSRAHCVANLSPAQPWPQSLVPFGPPCCDPILRHCRIERDRGQFRSHFASQGLRPVSHRDDQYASC